MKKAFTLLELIFVIVIIGILAGVASTSFRSDYLSADADFVLAKIKQAQYRGIGYEHKVFGSSDAPVDYEHGCIRLEKSALQESASEGDITYRLRVDAFDAGTLCFDSRGRPHDDDFRILTLRSEKKVIDLSYNGENKQIVVQAQSGFAIIKCN